MRYSRAIGLVVFVALWALASSAELVNPFLLPSPWAVAREGVELIVNGTLFPHVGMTLARLALGFAGGFLLGTVLGLSMGQSKSADSLFSFIVDFLRSIPVTALIPLSILILGIGELSRVALVVLASALVMAVNARAGVYSIPDTLKDVAHVYGIEGSRYIQRVLIPGALPLIANGFRLSLSISLVVVIVVEMFGTAQVGLGKAIIDAQFYFQTAELYALIFIAGLLGFMLNWVFTIAENRWIHWSGK
jgi:ABC-type nitrate/sulfonate/bicarbonate transport system permease component